MLIRVTSAEDAAVAAISGADAIEVAMDSGAIPDKAVLQAIRAAFPRTLRVRIADGDSDTIETAILAGADEIALPPGAIVDGAALLRKHPPDSRTVVLVALIPAGARQAETASGDAAWLAQVVAPLGAVAGLAASVVLDSEDDRLIDGVAMARLDAFAQACRAFGIPVGFAGGLEAPDVARLLVLRPDLLAFDVALRRDHRGNGPLDQKVADMMRALIPHEVSGRSSAAPVHGDDTDHIFVHDFVAFLSIGAYQAERGVRQRVRFSVDADVLRPAEPPTDMRGIFSYDIIIETIRVLASRAHVTFVETLAEELAATLLAYPQLDVVTVKVEKLDVIEGSVGIVIKRDRSAFAGAGKATVRV